VRAHETRSSGLAQRPVVIRSDMAMGIEETLGKTPNHASHGARPRAGDNERCLSPLFRLLNQACSDIATASWKTLPNETVKILLSFPVKIHTDGFPRLLESPGHLVRAFL